MLTHRLADDKEQRRGRSSEAPGLGVSRYPLVQRWLPWVLNPLTIQRLAA